jgi:hypothetical protein
MIFNLINLFHQIHSTIMATQIVESPVAIRITIQEDDGQQKKTTYYEDGSYCVDISDCETEYPGFERYWYDREGRLHDSNDEPASYVDDGMMYDSTYYRHGEVYRADDKPTHEHRGGYQYDANRDEWRVGGELHRETGPALIITRYGRFDKELNRGIEGVFVTKVWYNRDQIHRDVKPAKIWYDEHGQRRKATWYTHGVKGKTVRYNTSMTKGC